MQPIYIVLGQHFYTIPCKSKHIVVNLVKCNGIYTCVAYILTLFTNVVNIILNGVIPLVKILKLRLQLWWSSY